MLDEARLNSLPQWLGERESCQVLLECFDMLVKVGCVAVGTGGVNTAQTAPIPGGFSGAVGGLEAGRGGAPEHARHHRAVVDLQVGVR